jgi:hypothetical protein
MAIKSGIDSSKVESLNGINFRMWKRHISYILTHERTLYTLTTSRPKIIEENDGDAVKKCNTPSPLRLGLSLFFFYNKIFAKIHKVYQST